MKTLLSSKLWSKTLSLILMMLLVGWGFFGANSSGLGVVDASAAKKSCYKNLRQVSIVVKSSLKYDINITKPREIIDNNPIVGGNSSLAYPVAFVHLKYKTSGLVSTRPPLGSKV